MIKNILNKLKSITQKSFKGSINSRNIDSWLKINSGDIAIDCGANIGDVTEKIARMGAFVYAFEPNPYAFEFLKERMDSFDNVQCINKAVWIEDGIMPLYLHKNSEENKIYWSSGSSLSLEKSNIDIDSFVKVETIDLSRFIKDIGKEINFLKIDIEGAECEVVEKLLDERVVNLVKNIVVETHDNKYSNFRKKTQSLRDRIKKEGFRNIRMDWE